MKRFVLPLVSLLSLAPLGACDEKPSGVGAYAQKLFVVAGKTAVTVTVDGQVRQVDPGRVEEIGVSVGKHHFLARTLSAGTFTAELDIKELDEVIVPVAVAQCFATLDAKKRKIVRRQTHAQPMPRSHVPVVVAADDERRNGVYHAQMPCNVGDVPESDLYSSLSQGLVWEDLILPGGGAHPNLAGDANNETEPPPSMEEEGVLAARRPSIEQYLKLVDQAAGANHVGRTEGRSPTAIWAKDGKVAIANLAADMVSPPAGKPALAKAKKIGAAVKAVLSKKPTTAPGEVVALDNLELFAVDKETVETYQKQYQGIVRETFPVKRREGPEAVVFLYRIGRELWISQSMKRSFAAAGIDLAMFVGEMDKNESAAVAQCVAQIATVKAGSCATTKTETEASVRLHRLMTAPPASPLYVQLLLDSKTGQSDLRLFEAPPPKLARDQTTIGFNLRVGLSGLTGD